MVRLAAKHNPFITHAADVVEFTYTKVDSLEWDVGIQFKLIQERGNEDVREPIAADIYIVPPTGPVEVEELTSIIITVPDGGSVVGVSGDAFSHGTVISGEFGNLVIRFQSSGPKQFRLAVALPNGALAVSEVIDTSL
jgi:hypothetical protein